jgi:hypothetical protein
MAEKEEGLAIIGNCAEHALRNETDAVILPLSNSHQLDEGFSAGI